MNSSSDSCSAILGSTSVLRCSVEPGIATDVWLPPVSEALAARCSLGSLELPGDAASAFLPPALGVFDSAGLSRPCGDAVNIGFDARFSATTSGRRDDAGGAGDPPDHVGGVPGAVLPKLLSFARSIASWNTATLHASCFGSQQKAKARWRIVSSLTITHYIICLQEIHGHAFGTSGSSFSKT